MLPEGFSLQRQIRIQFSCLSEVRAGKCKFSAIVLTYRAIPVNDAAMVVIVTVERIENGEKGFISQRSAYIQKDRLITSFTKTKTFFERGKTMGSLRKIVLCCGLAVLSVGIAGVAGKFCFGSTFSDIQAL